MQQAGFLKKTTALAVIFCFAFLLQVSVQPLSAAPADQGDFVNEGADQGQGLLEVEESDTRSYARKSSLTPIIIGLLAAGVVAAVLFLVVLKKSYDITGVWTLNYKWSHQSSFSPVSITFSGNKKSGSFSTQPTGSGTYTVDGKNVQWNFSGGGNAVYVGTFSDKNSMSGTMTTPTMTGVWNATRAAGSSNTGSTLLKNGIKADGSY